jgi:hypothetical protein
MDPRNDDGRGLELEQRRSADPEEEEPRPDSGTGRMTASHF